MGHLSTKEKEKKTSNPSKSKKNSSAQTGENIHTKNRPSPIDGRQK